ncbi:MAG: M28 family peptidase [Acidobacteria bacterium]|jgi:Iap family predicted aminopeptidase|nr:M28 family peptidase [Acidobacteriota bacterium]
MNKYLQIKNSILILFTICIFGYAPFAQQTTVKISTEEEIKEDINLNVCKNAERLEAVKKLFQKMGAKDTNIKIEKIKDAENLFVIKKGKTDETVIIGAHYDKTSDGCGVIDNWTGIVILTNLYRSMKDFSTEKTYIFAAFGKEELGLVGSDEMARAIPKEKRANYCAMVNFDSFGFTYPQVMTNISDTKLADLAKEVSDEFKIPFGKAAIDFASSDSESFRKQKIPAVSLHGLSDKWKEYLHSTKDKTENVNSTSVYIGYRFALSYLAKIDAKNCNAFRK